MRNAGPLFRDVVPWTAAVQRLQQRQESKQEESVRDRLAREYGHFMEHAPMRAIVEIQASPGIPAHEETLATPARKRALLECGHYQTAGTSGWYRAIRCLRCYQENEGM